MLHEMSPSAVINRYHELQHSKHVTKGPDIYDVPCKKSTVMHRSLSRMPPHVTSSIGNYLHLSNGQEIFDASGGAAVSCLGHGNQRVHDALLDQMNQVSYCHSFFFGTDAAEDLARILIESTGGEMARAFFISSGSEAMESALKLARQYHLEKPRPEPQRTRFVARQQSYHGTTLGALAVGGHLARRALFEPLLALDTARVSPCYPYRAANGSELTNAAYVRQLEAELDSTFRQLGPDTIAAFVAEPVVGAALGCVPPVPGYFEAVRRVCDRHGVLLIFDEVMCGAGRVGPEPTVRYPRPLHAWQDPLVNVVPDIMTLGKGLGGGYIAVAAMLANHRIVKALSQGSDSFSHGQTYQGHPLACRAALEVQRIIRDENLVANVRQQGELLGQLLQEQVGHHPSVGNIRGKGLFWGIEFVVDKETKRPYPPSEGVASGIHAMGLQEPYNISLYPGNGSVDGYQGDHILLAPAYNVTTRDIHDIVQRVVSVIGRYFDTMQAE